MNLEYITADNYTSNITASWAVASSDFSRNFERESKCTPNATFDCDLSHAQFYIFGASALWLLWGLLIYYVDAYYDKWLF
jgi:hypothetical protein